MKVNCNNSVSFVLTKAGAAVWNKRFDDLAGYAIKLPPTAKEGDNVTTQLHEVMNVFGPEMCMGGAVPFLGLSLDITPDDEPKATFGPRDEFAIAALPKLIRDGRTYKDTAAQAYFMADAMMEARK